MSIDNKVHLNGLNGIRAIAALAVVFSHISTRSAPFGIEQTENGIDLAGFGVTMFFCLSGYLITYLLLLEKQKTDINVKNFYMRRILRIWPLYYVYLFVAVITLLLFKLPWEPALLPYYVLLAANVPSIFGTGLPLTGHLWSIGVEEQFYLFWPWIIKNSHKLLRVIFLFTIVFVCFKLAFRVLEIRYGYSIPYAVIAGTRYDCMAIGGIGAILFHKGNLLFIRVCTSMLAQLTAWLVVVLLAFNRFHIASVIDHNIVALLTVVIIFNVSSNPKSIIKLNQKMFDFIGRISYGIYVIHPLVIFFLAVSLGRLISSLNLPLRYGVVYTVIPLLTILLAFASYELYEKRFLRLKQNFSVIKSHS